MAAREHRPRCHVVLSRPFDLDAMERGASREENPRHVLHGVKEALGATVHVPSPSDGSAWDRVLALLVGKPMHWALARRLARVVRDDEVVYCAGDDVGIPFAILCRLGGKRPAVAVWVMEPSKKRFRVLSALFGLRERVARFVVNTPRKVLQLRQLGIAADRVYELRDQTDTRFFSPGPRSGPSGRPVIFSAGLERRDYRTLALATAELDVEVRVAAVSPNARASLSAFPDPVPANMSFGDYPWPRYRQAFRDCDLVVVPLLEADYSPGLTVVLEAMASRKPVVATRTPGAMEDLAARGLVIGVAPGDANGLRDAIRKLLDDPAAADAQAERGFRFVLDRHDSDQVVEEMVELVDAMAAPGR